MPRRPFQAGSGADRGEQAGGRSAHEDPHPPDHAGFSGETPDRQSTQDRIAANGSDPAPADTGRPLADQGFAKAGLTASISPPCAAGNRPGMPRTATTATRASSQQQGTAGRPRSRSTGGAACWNRRRTRRTSITTSWWTDQVRLLRHGLLPRDRDNKMAETLADEVIQASTTSTDGNTPRCGSPRPGSPKPSPLAEVRPTMVRGRITRAWHRA